MNKNKFPIKTVAIFIATVTLIFFPKILDPFNTSKFLILLVTGFYLLGKISFGKYDKKSTFAKNRYVFIPLIMFILFSTLSTFFSDNILMSLLGDTQRKNGLLSLIALSIYLFSMAIFSNFQNVSYILLALLFCGFINIAYGALQLIGEDPISWNNPYNSIIGTFGNPNFSSAFLAMFGIALFVYFWSKHIKWYLRFLIAVFLIVTLYEILSSSSKQGMVVFLIGTITFSLTQNYLRRSNKVFVPLGLASFVLLVLAILGMLNSGPLKSYLYKDSISIRGFYWRAAIKMFEQNPIFGVGIDRFESYFKQVREVQYSLRYGDDITSSNAHNVFLQYFATGGVVVGLCYVFINLYVIKRVFVSIKNQRFKASEDTFTLTLIFAVWVGYQAQSFISIDQLGLAVWGWSLTGVLIALTRNVYNDIHFEKSTNAKPISRQVLTKPNSGNFQTIASGIFAIVAMIPCLIIYTNESYFYKSLEIYNSGNSMASFYKDYSEKGLRKPFLEPSVKVQVAQNLFRYNFPQEGKLVLQKLLLEDSRNLNALRLASFVAEAESRFADALYLRKKIEILDPWNLTNLVALGSDANQVNDKVEIGRVVSRLNNYPLKTPEVVKALDNVTTMLK